MAKRKRRMAGTKEAVVLRLLHGEDMELVSRESGFGLHELKKWLDQYRRGGREVQQLLEQRRFVVQRGRLSVLIGAPGTVVVKEFDVDVADAPRALLGGKLDNSL